MGVHRMVDIPSDYDRRDGEPSVYQPALGSAEDADGASAVCKSRRNVRLGDNPGSAREKLPAPAPVLLPDRRVRRNFYYSIFMWDKILHLLGGAEAVFMGYELATAMQKRDKKQCDLPIVLLCALGFSFFISTCWELFEFSFDQIAGGDSQHWSYELAKAANNTRTFFKPRDPARFALMDTMTDIVFNTLGAVPFYIILKIAPYHHKGKNNVNEMFAPKGAEKELAQVK